MMSSARILSLDEQTRDEPIVIRRSAGRRQCHTADKGADSPGRRLGGPIAHAQAHSHRE